MFGLWFISAGFFLRSQSAPVSPDVNNNLNFQFLERDATTNFVVAVVPIEGIITEEGRGPENMANTVKEMLRSARENPNVKAVILEVQSPGGTVNASDLIWNEVVKVKKSGKPVVAFFNGLAASGGYYVSTPADKIVATPETMTGSIGVIMQSPDFSELMGKVGVKFNTIKSGPQKDILSPYKPMDEEAQKILQGMVDRSYGRFVKKVAEGRKLDEKVVRKIADGRIYDAEEAFNNGLIDELGYIESAFIVAKGLAKIEQASLVRCNRRVNIFGGLFSKVNLDPLASVKQQMPLGRPGMYYLWIGD